MEKHKSYQRKGGRVYSYSIIILLMIATGCDNVTSPDTSINNQQSAIQSSGQINAQDASPVKIPGQYIVVFRDHVQDVPGVARGLLQAHGGDELHIYQYALKGFAVANLPEPALVALERNPFIAYVEQDGIASIGSNTVQENATWGLDRIDQRQLPLNELYHYTATGAGVNVYVIDSGIRTTHEEFGGRASLGYDFVDDGKDDCIGHGTHVAGTIGGETWGVAKDVSLIDLRVFGCSGDGSWSTVNAAVDWITANHESPAVVNMSLGGLFYQSINDAVAGSIDAGLTYVTAAGNDGSNACNYSPASLPESITVGSTTDTDARSGFSNKGSCVDIFAPGTGITSAWHTSNSATNTVNGTSMATPHVAGAVALYLENNTNDSPADVWNAIKAAATVDELTGIGEGSPNLLLYSLFDDLPANGDVPTTVTIDADPSPAAFGQEVTFTAEVRGNSAVTTGTVSFISVGTCESPNATLALEVALDSNGEAFHTSSTLSAGDYTITACYSGADGFEAADGSVELTVNPVATMTTLTIDPDQRQYSDIVTLTAKVSGENPTGSVTFELLDGSNWTEVANASLSSDMASKEVQVTSAVGTATFRAVFSSTNDNFSGSTSESEVLTIEHEDATITYHEDNPAALQVSSAGGDLDAGELELLVEVQENETTPTMAAPGDIGLAGLSVQLVPVGPGGTVDLTCTSTVNGTGYSAFNTFTCTNSGPMEVNSYEVQVSVTGDYYMAQPYTDVFTLYDPSQGFTTGGGTFELEGDRVNFGFVMRYNPAGRNLQGNLLLVRHHSNGTTSRLKSNALGVLTLGSGSGFGWASFDGRSTYTSWDSSSDNYVTAGNQAFTVYLEDYGDSGISTDRIWVKGSGAFNMAGTLGTASNNTEVLTGGTISVPQPVARGRQ
ncbi:S8 family serine peptidase [Rhodohalobacter sp. SW132]|nr:S8 family serine peptidase [Rhodohalobacter sp. SW132]